MSDARPFKLINASERAVLEKKFTEATRAWAQAWFAANVDDAEIKIVANDLSSILQLEDGVWRKVTTDGGLWLGLHIAADAELGLIDALSSQSQRLTNAAPSPLVRAAMRDAYIDFANVLFETLGAGKSGAAVIVEEPIAADSWRYGSGTVLAEIGVSSFRCLMLLPLIATMWPRRRSEQGRFASLTGALSAHKCAVRVWAGEVELEFAVLSSLQPGDVIKLDSAIDRPLLATVERDDEAGARLCEVSLGKQDGHTAVQIIH